MKVRLLGGIAALLISVPMVVSADVMNVSQSGAATGIEPINGLGQNVCNGEPLAYDGTLRWAYSIIENGKMTRTVSEYNVQIDAIGLDSGTKYKGLENFATTYMYTEGLPTEPQTEVQQLRFRLISAGGQFLNVLYTYTFQRIFDHNGNVRVFLTDEALECI